MPVPRVVPFFPLGSGSHRTQVGRKRAIIMDGSFLPPHHHPHFLLRILPSSASNTMPIDNSSPDGGEPARKRSRSSTIKKPIVSMPAVSVASIDADVELMDAEGDATRPLQYESRSIVVIGTLTAGNSLVNPEVLGKMGELLDMQVSSQLSILDFVVGRYVLASSDDQWELIKAIQKAMEGGHLPQQLPFSSEDDAPLGILWWRAGGSRAGHLVKSKESAYRVWKGRSFIWAAPLVSVWPPPLVAGPGIVENTVWVLQLKCADTEQSALRVIARQLEARFIGAFFAVVCDGDLCETTLLTFLLRSPRTERWPAATGTSACRRRTARRSGILLG